RHAFDLRSRVCPDPLLPASQQLGQRTDGGMSIKKITRLPENDKTNGWSRLLAPRTPKPALAKDVQADWVIVGGGLAGLAAARRLAENRPGDSIVVLEADLVGEGAQGRNSGFAID